MEKKANILGKTRKEILSLTAKFVEKRMSDLIDNQVQPIPVAASVWNVLLDSHAKENEPKPCIAEEAVAILIRKGVKRENLKFSMWNITIKLPNGSYRSYREPSSYGSGAFSFQAGAWLRVHNGLDAEELAEFILAFDEMLPIISEKERPVLEAIEEIRLRKRAEEMAREIARQAFEKAFKDVLDPMKIQYTFTLNADGTVSVNLKQRLSGKVSGPVNEVRDILSDPEKVKALLAPDGGLDMPFGRFSEMDMLI